MWTNRRHDAETLRLHMADDAAAFAALEARANQRDAEKRANDDLWRHGLGQRLDQQDEKLDKATTDQQASIQRVQNILLSIAGFVGVTGIGVIGWLLAPLLHGAVGK